MSRGKGEGRLRRLTPLLTDRMSPCSIVQRTRINRAHYWMIQIFGSLAHTMSSEIQSSERERDGEIECEVKLRKKIQHIAKAKIQENGYDDSSFPAGYLGFKRPGHLGRTTDFVFSKALWSGASCLPMTIM